MQKITILISGNRNSNIITKDEIEATVAMGEEAGIIKEKHTNIIENILELNKIKVKDIHTPRNVMFSIQKKDLEDSLSYKSTTSIDTEKLKIYSRVPIYNDDFDDIVGMILSKEYFYELNEDKLEDNSKIIKPIFKINENVPVSKLLDLFLSRKEHMFIVVDNYDQTEGIVTLEDALETLLGTEIIDELDQDIDMREVAKNLKK